MKRRVADNLVEGMKILKRPLDFGVETVRTLSRLDLNPLAVGPATNSSQRGACSCEQHCEQVKVSA